MAKKPILEAILISYNSQFWLKKALLSLQQYVLNQPAFTITITVVDNNSTDGTLAMITKDFPQVKLIKLSANQGYAYANNVAIKQSSAEYVLFLNSDVEATKATHVATLVEFMEAHQDVGVVTPKVIFSNGQLDKACHRGEPTVWASFCHFSHLELLFSNSPKFAQYHQTYKSLDTIHTIDACSGAAMLIRTAILSKTGLFDEQFFMYAEDLDLCKRVRESGFLVTYHPGASIIHHKYKSGIRGSSKKIAQTTKLHFYDTMLQYYDKHYAQVNPRFLRQVIRVVIQLKKGVS